MFNRDKLIEHIVEMNKMLMADRAKNIDEEKLRVVLQPFADSINNVVARIETLEAQQEGRVN